MSVLSGQYYGTGFKFFGPGSSTLTDYFVDVGQDGFNASPTSSVSDGFSAIRIFNATLTNDGGSVTGGEGGYNNYGQGGAGGAGVTTYGGHLTSSGSIAGGVGGFGITTGGNGGAGVEIESGVLGHYYATSVTNSGTIAGGAEGSGVSTAINTAGSLYGGVGVLMDVSGSLSNERGGLIEGGAPSNGVGGVGVELKNGGSVTDAGYIAGGSAPRSYQTLGGIGVDLANGGSIDVSSTGKIKGGDSTEANGAGGTGVYLNGGTLTTAGAIDGGSGLGSSGRQGYSVDFGPTSARMIVSQYASFSGDIGGFHHGDTIDLTKVAPSYIESYFNSATDTVYASIDGTLTFANDPTLTFRSDGAGGTIVGCACFRRGTRIATEHGERPIETLAIGDTIRTQSGLRTLRWIGKRHYSGQALFDRPDMMPVLVRAGALGQQLPQRDLWVSRSTRYTSTVR